MLFFTACTLCSALALAPTPSPSPSAPPQIAHVYTSDRSDTTLRNTARIIYTVSRAEIERNGYRTVAQALRDVPALVISPLGAIGSSVNFTLRGSASAQTLVLIDGVPAPGSFSNSAELGNLPTTGVERIEVVEGGGSTLYGAGAIGGIINIITQRAAKTNAVLRNGSFGDRELELNLPNVQFDRIVAANAFGLPGGSTRTDADYQSTAFHGNLDRRFGAFDATLRAGAQADHLGAPGPSDFLSLSSREDDLNQSADFTLAHQTPQSQATLQLGASEQRIQYRCNAVVDPNCFQVFPSLSTEGRFDLGLRNSVRGDGEQLLYGIDLSRGGVRSDGGAGVISRDVMAQAAAYVQEHEDTRWGSFYAGVRGERDGVLGGEFSPSAGLVLRLSGSLALKGNLATAFRAPNATELFFPGYGNSTLKPERAQVGDISVVDSSLLGGTSLGWFGNRTRDLIVAEPVSAPGAACAIDPSSFVYEPCNVDHAFIEGLTFVTQTLELHGFVASLNVTDLYRAQDLDAQRRLPNDPVVGASLRLEYTNHGSGLLDGFGIAARSAGARGTVNATAPLFGQPAAYTDIDAYLSMRAGALLVSLRGMNLGDERYASVAGFPLPGRSFMVELRVR